MLYLFALIASYDYAPIPSVVMTQSDGTTHAAPLEDGVDPYDYLSEIADYCDQVQPVFNGQPILLKLRHSSAILELHFDCVTRDRWINDPG